MSKGDSEVARPLSKLIDTRPQGRNLGRISSGINATTSALPAGGQGWVSVTFSADQPAGTVVHLATTSGTQIASYQPAKAFRGVVFSSGQITRGTTYAVRTGGGLYPGGTLSGAQVAPVTAGVR